jgi:hypothetical protein
VTEKTIAIFVRKGESDERLLSFNPPKDIPQAELLAHGFALDGHAATRSIPRSSPGGTFTERLFAAQNEIVAWLQGHGYTVEFR